MKYAKTLTILTTLLALPAFAANPYEMPDDAWISISGEVESVNVDSFLLDYGDGLVTVEMNGWDWYAENSALLAGDLVTVYGEIDDDFFEATTIEADSVYVESLGSYFYASPADEESWVLGQPVYTVTTPIVVANVEVRGMVESVGEREFTIGTGTTDLTVDTSNLPYNPLDDEGFQQIDTGDYVLVNGIMDSGFIGDVELDADYVVTLSEDPGK